jgi:prepilin-type processing-associated H-X9-DG protein
MRGVVKIAIVAAVVLFISGLGVIGIIQWREKANRARCQDHLRQVGWYGLWEYVDQSFAFPNGRNAPGVPPFLPPDREPRADRRFPPGTIPHAKLAPDDRLSWHVQILPHIGQSAIYERLNLSLGWNGEPNRHLVQAIVKQYVCPSLYEPAGFAPALTHFVGVSGIGEDAAYLNLASPKAGLLRNDDGTPIGAIKDGLSYTLSIIETSNAPGPWMAGGSATLRGISSQSAPLLGKGRAFGGAHPRGVNAAFADGHIRFIAESVSPAILESFAGIADGADLP